MPAYVDAQQDYYPQNHRWAHRIVAKAKKMACTGKPKASDVPSPLGPNFSPQRQRGVTTATISRIISDGTAALLAFDRCITAKPGVMKFMWSARDDHLSGGFRAGSGSKVPGYHAFCARRAVAGRQVTQRGVVAGP
ncbi:hypothetical protein KCP69_24345 [Salmonella enterica subsp. enterica]|nr:hypothetical protein KCP69_24345 [Salmonella enterica subsp. enterica]